jgi:uncharacterized protein YjbI with pentapeptide repeats
MDDHPTRRQRRPPRPVWLGAVLLVALVGTLMLAPIPARTTVRAAPGTLVIWLRPTMWIWPLAAALTLAALTSPAARRRWPQREARILLAIATFAVLVAIASRPRVGLLALGAMAAVGLLAAWVLVLPRRLAPPVPEQDLDAVKEPDRRLELADARVKLQNDLRTTALQAIAGLAVLAGAVLGFQQLTEDRQQATAARELALQGQASERFTRAIDQLGSDRLEVQLGGIYGLEQIAQQAPANRLAVTEVLVAYLHRRRVPQPQPAKLPSGASPVEELGVGAGELRVRAPDVQAALTVLGRRQTALDDPPLDLRALDVSAADLGGANLRAAHLDGANLRGANLARADLRAAYLRGANLSAANLVDANLELSDLRNAHIRAAFFWGANLAGAYFDQADLRDAEFFRANLHDANLRDTNLRDADLHSADLARADLRGASLRDVDLRDADLRSANLARAALHGANLRGADLRGANLRDATAHRTTTWPDGFDWQNAGVRQERGAAGP